MNKAYEFSGDAVGKVAAIEKEFDAAQAEISE
jgi:hypothetical protein